MNESHNHPEPDQPQSSRDSDGALKRLRNLFFYTEEEKAAMRKQSTPTPPPSTHQPGIAQYLSIGRNNATGAWVITIDGQQFSNWQELEQGGYATRVDAIIATLKNTPHTTKAEPTSIPDTPNTINTELEQSSVSFEQKPPPPAPVPPRQPEDDDDDAGLGSFMGNMRKAVRGRGRNKADSPNVPLSMADQIEAIVQDMLETHETLRERYIHILATASGLLSIVVDDHHYEAVGDIQDDEVRALVQEAIREWERRS